MSNGTQHCPICTLDVSVEQIGSQVDTFRFDCRRCGQFKMPYILLRILETLGEEDRRLLPFLSAYTRQETEKGILVELRSENWQDFARAHATTPVPRKIERLLELVAARSSRPGDKVPIDAAHDYPLLDASSAEELIYLVDHLVKLRYLTKEGGGYYFVVTVEGWERLEPPAGGGGIPGRCFIAMSFHPSLDDAYQLGIRPAIKECGFDPIRVDKVHHNEKICDKILAEIRLAQFVVADFTLQRAGVYFEAEFAMGLGRPVIWMCREDDFENTHFDTRQYNHIVWSTPDDLKAKLNDRIHATILR